MHNNRLHEDTAPRVSRGTAPVKRSVLRHEKMKRITLFVIAIVISVGCHSQTFQRSTTDKSHLENKTINDKLDNKPRINQKSVPIMINTQNQKKFSFEDFCDVGDEDQFIITGKIHEFVPNASQVDTDNSWEVWHSVEIKIIEPKVIAGQSFLLFADAFREIDDRWTVPNAVFTAIVDKDFIGCAFIDIKDSSISKWSIQILKHINWEKPQNKCLQGTP